MSKKTTAAIEKKKVGWLDNIAEKSGYDRKIVERFLKKYNIKQSPNTGTPKRVNFLDISFSGQKKGEYNNDFKFEFADLNAGVWGILSDKNGKGKTTALEVIKWLFKGKASADLQSGVKSWINEAALKFRIDDKKYLLSLQQADNVVSGQIELLKGDIKNSVVSEFNSEDEMAEVVSDFWLNELGLNQIASFRQSGSEVEAGKEVVHGWPALAAALFIGTDYGALFGDTALSGLPTRILNMFLGLPWISTHAALKALDGQLKSEAQVETVFEDRDKENRRQRLVEIQSELKLKREELALRPIPQFNNDGYNDLQKQYNVNYAAEKTAYLELIDEEDKAELVTKEWVLDKKKLNSFLEDKAANAVFKRLNPTCCPHCESKITQEQLEKEKNEHTCAICDKRMIDTEDSDIILSELEESVRASAAMCDLMKNSVRSKKLRHANLTQSITDLKAAMDEYEENLQTVRAAQTELDGLKHEVTRLEILEEEYKTARTVESIKTAVIEDEKEKPVAEVIDENKILQTAIKITHARFKDLQDELLQDVNERILGYCKIVGLSQYQSVALTSNPHLKIDKDGSPTSYSNVSKGEQLRLKVIVTIALISVAEERGLGRHPGFLVIDSPAAQEVNPEDLNNLINGLEGLCKVLPSLQIIIASVASPTLLAHIDDKQRLHAKGNDFLW